MRRAGRGRKTPRDSAGHTRGMGDRKRRKESQLVSDMQVGACARICPEAASDQGGDLGRRGGGAGAGLGGQHHRWDGEGNVEALNFHIFSPSPFSNRRSLRSKCGLFQTETEGSSRVSLP